MTKKDYVLIANILHEEVEHTDYIYKNEYLKAEGEARLSMLHEVMAERKRTVSVLIRKFADAFKQDNAQFSEERFRALVYKAV